MSSESIRLSKWQKKLIKERGIKQHAMEEGSKRAVKMRDMVIFVISTS